MSEENTGVNDQAAADEQTVPVSVLQAIREELKEVKDTANLYRTQLQHIQMNQTQTQQPRTPQVEIPDDEVMTGKELKMALGALVQGFQQELNSLRVQNQNNDFEEVINKNLPKVLEKKPHLGHLLNSIQDQAARAALAYEFGTQDPDYKKKKGEKATDDFVDLAKKAKTNSEKPGNIGSETQQTSVSPEDKFLNMTDAEIDAHLHKVRFGKK